MDSENRYTGIDETISRLIRRKARQLIGHAGYTSNDLPDLEQEFYIVILEHIHKFDREKGSTQVFLNCLVERHAGRLIKSRQAQCRDWRLFASLPDDMHCISEPDALSEFERAECRIDAERLLEILPCELVVLASRLMVMTPLEISRKYSIPRTSIYRQIELIRQILNEKSKNKSDSFTPSTQLTMWRRKK